LHYGAKVDQKTDADFTPFMRSVDEQFFAVAQVLLDAGADINKRSGLSENSALHTAVELNRSDTVQFLLRNNANPNQQNAAGKTPFDLVIEGLVEKEIINLFEKYGMVIFPNLKYNILFQNPLKWDHSIDDLYRIELLNCWARLFASTTIDQKYRVKSSLTLNGVMVNKYGCIVNRISYEYLKSLFGKEVAAVINVNLVTVCKRALELVENNNSQELEKHIKQYPFVTTYDDDLAEKMSLCALRQMDAKCLKVLLENKIDSHRCFINGTSFLHQAVLCNNIQAIELLMEYGVDCMQPDKFGQLPTSYVTTSQSLAKLNECMSKEFVKELRENNYQRCKQLLLHITDCNLLFNRGETLIHAIVNHYDHENDKYIKKYIKILMDKGADFNLRNDNGDTPLWDEIGRIGNKDICALLLHAGARIDIRINCGVSCLDIAVIRKNIELVKLFLQYGAEVTSEMLDRFVEKNDEDKDDEDKYGTLTHSGVVYPSKKVWEGIEILQQAYDKQQQHMRKQQDHIEAANKELSGMCVVCFEKPDNIKKIPCHNKHDAWLCDGCCHKLYKQHMSCPICFGSLS
jgi:ankyrin repeat protein